MNSKPLIVQTVSYTSEWTKLAPNLISLKRKHLYSKNFETIDTFGDFNLYAYAYLNKGDLKIKVHDLEQEVYGLVSIFIPKFSIIHWKIFSPGIEWNAFISREALYPSKNNICIYKNALLSPKDTKEITRWLESEKMEFIFNQNMESSVVKNIKNYIDINFQDSIEISDIAQKFNLSSSQLSKIFKNKYGLSPVEYRSKLRVFQSIYDLLTQEKEVVDIAFNSGFNDLSRFNKQFKKITNTTPSKFKF